MTTSITERDKVLLTVIGVFGITAFFLAMIILPIEHSRRELQQQTDANVTRIGQMEVKMSLLEIAEQEYETNIKELIRIQSAFYPMMKSQEIDRLMIEKMMLYGVSAQEMQITLPEEASDVPVFLLKEEAGSNPEHDSAGIYLATVNMRIRGTMERLDRLLDDLTQQMPGIWVTELNWERQSGDSSGEWILALELQIGMSTQQ
ncbi:MAG: hypothetical protein ACRDBO_08220 [Lachnospiraceae bacterium]